MSKPPNSADHSWVQEVMPWYVNESLSVDDQARVKAHMANCSICREDCQCEQELAAAINAAPVVSYAPHHSLQKLMQVIDKPSLKTRLSGWLPSFGGTVGFSLPSGQWLWPSVVGMQALAVAVLAIVLSSNVNQPINYAEYQTLSSPVAKGAHLQVVFDDAISTKHMSELLAAIDGSIISGPSGNGLFLVAVPLRDADTLEQAANTLLEQQGVRFVAVKEAQ